VKITLLNFTPIPVKTVALAAKPCNSESTDEDLEDRVKGISFEKFLGNTIDTGHHPVPKNIIKDRFPCPFCVSVKDNL
jgi:hypothetical protein